MNFKSLKKASATVMAAAMMLNSSLIGSANVIAASDSGKIEFEDAVITGDVTVESSSSASGGSCLKMTDSGSISLTFSVKEDGIYKMVIYAGGIGGSKQQKLTVNGVPQGDVAIPSSSGFEAVTIPAIKLKAGENTLLIEKNWGWTNFDYLTVEPATLPNIFATDLTCVDEEIIPEGQKLMNYMASIYGKNIISGQQEIYKNDNVHGFEYEFEYLQNLTGELPAIRGFDYGNFTCPAFGSDDGSTERIIDWVKNKNGIATASWHLNVPTDFASYTLGSYTAWENTTYSEKTDFSPEAAATEGTKENQYYKQALTTLAAEFKELEALGIPVLWRPLHEAEGGGGETKSWFWWGREGSEAYKKLWIYTYETLTNEFDCHNLIWEWNSYDFSTSYSWYPGDEYVDIIGYDKYNCTDWSTGSPVIKHNDSAISSTFYSIMERYNNAKMVAMTENDCFSTVENLTTEKAGWLYFCTWYDGGSPDINFLSDPRFNTKEDTIAMYQSDYCITLDELPADLYSNNIVVTTTTRDPNTTTTTTTTTTRDPDKFVFEAFGEAVEVTKNGVEGETLTITIKGEPTASIGGGLCYTSGGEWASTEWSGNADSKGNLVVELDLGKVPADATGFEVQVWWSNVWDAANEVGIDQPCEIVSVVESGSQGTTDPTDPTEPDEDFVFELVKYTIDLPEGSKAEKLLAIELEGAAAASVGGGLCFTGADGEWTQVEWSGNLDADGIGSFQIPLTDVPDDVVSAEVQIWWSNIWDAANEVGIDKPCEMVSYEVFGQGADPDVKYGDADLDGSIGISDVVLVMCYAGNKNEYTISEEGQVNADVYQTGDGVGASDALSIQKFIAQVITVLPESYLTAE